MAIQYNSLGHVALRAREADYPKLEKFFIDTMGFKKAFDLINENGETWITYFRTAPGQYIEIIPGIPSNPCEYFDGTKPRCESSHYHQCFQVKDRFKVVEELETKRGIKVNRKEDDSVGLCKSHCLFINDPLGGEWELMEFTPESLQLTSDKNPAPDPETGHDYINRLTHVTFCCKDYPKMVKFYTETLGLEKAFTINFDQEIIDGYLEKGYPLEAKPGDEWITYIRVSSKEFIELFNVPYKGENDTKNQEFHHFCLIVEDIFEAAKEFEEKGFTLWHGPIWMQDPFKKPFAEEGVPGQCGSLAFYIQDPEGNEIEIMQYTENSLQVLNDHE